MQIPRMHTFAEALEDAHDHMARPHLLLGNGFSIACRSDCFSYAALLDEATFEGAHGDVMAVFGLLGTTDFERVIELLRTAASLVDAYRADDPDLAGRLREDAGVIRDALATTLAARHPDLPFSLDETEYEAARAFLSNFGRVYTLNYDMLLYWTVMHEGEEDVPTNDGFTEPDDPDAEYVVWEPYLDFGNQRLFFLHGGLHLYDTGSEISKITWSRTGTPLIEQIRDALAEAKYPLIVTEGSSRDKEAKILHNAYLNHALRSFAKVGKVMFIFGHSLASSDEHILRRIAEGKLTRLYVSIYGDPTSEENQAIISRAEALAAGRPARRPLVVQFFDAATATVWG